MRSLTTRLRVSRFSPKGVRCFCGALLAPAHLQVPVASSNRRISGRLSETKRASTFGDGTFTVTFFPNSPPHVTEFCSNLIGVGRNVPLGTKTVTTGSPYSFQFGDCDGRHNCADEDCEDYNALVLFMETHPP